MGEFFASPFEIIAVFGLDGILDGAGGGVVDTQDRALHQLDLSGRVTAQLCSSAVGRRSPWGLSLAPLLGGRGLTARIWRGNTTGNTKRRGGVVTRLTRVNGWGATVGIVIGSFGGIGLGEAVTGGRADGRYSSVVWVIERSIERALGMR